MFFNNFDKFFFKKKKIIWLIRHGKLIKTLKNTTILIKSVMKFYSNLPKAILYCSKFSKNIHEYFGILIQFQDYSKWC